MKQKANQNTNSKRERICDVALLMSVAWIINFGSWDDIYHLDFLKGPTETVILVAVLSISWYNLIGFYYFQFYFFPSTFLRFVSCLAEANLPPFDFLRANLSWCLVLIFRMALESFFSLVCLSVLEFYLWDWYFMLLFWVMTCVLYFLCYVVFNFFFGF